MDRLNESGKISQEIWRAGNILVMRRGAQLPDRCIKTNQPANGKRFKAILYWHHPAIYLVILLNLLIYVIIAIFVRKKAVVYFGVSEEVLQKRRRAILWGWGVGVAGIILFFSALSLQSQLAMAIFLLPVGQALMLGGLIGGSARATIVNVYRIEDEYIWIRGVAKEYLALLPEWNHFTTD
ncbi:hypothetical protein [Limnofasciculus baicalensis]|uniref:Uncharacterized protein n=1 Tax=Limnofasciculus baicalensis BBK-W-15 TaxID=2699891 RepID=A0AAE3GYB5_9CYAN|nr:hypothetical protein [Limnofasciculus baicalensis]MCP2730852.1 hypothetical protein [Limnofasciculus baicalensis BBK-W-15]